MKLIKFVGYGLFLFVFSLVSLVFPLGLGVVMAVKSQFRKPSSKRFLHLLFFYPAIFQMRTILFLKDIRASWREYLKTIEKLEKNGIKKFAPRLAERRQGKLYINQEENKNKTVLWFVAFVAIDWILFVVATLIIVL